MVTVCSLTLWLTFAYLTYDDMHNLPSLRDQTVMVIRAPAETKLEVPHPEEVRVRGGGSVSVVGLLTGLHVSASHCSEAADPHQQRSGARRCVRLLR